MSDMIVSTETWMLLRFAMLILAVAGFAATLGLSGLVRTARR
jgi:hypothetical protein